MGGFVAKNVQFQMPRCFAIFRLLMMFEGPRCKNFCNNRILIRYKVVYFNQNNSEIFTSFAENLHFLKRWGRKTFGIKNRVILKARSTLYLLTYNEARLHNEVPLLFLSIFNPKIQQDTRPQVSPLSGSPEVLISFSVTLSHSVTSYLTCCRGLILRATVCASPAEAVPDTVSWLADLPQPGMEPRSAAWEARRVTISITQTLTLRL